MQRDPMEMIMAIVIESSMTISQELVKKIQGYKQIGIDVIPISELDDIISNAMKKCSAPESFVAHMLNKTEEPKKES